MLRERFATNSYYTPEQLKQVQEEEESPMTEEEKKELEAKQAKLKADGGKFVEEVMHPEQKKSLNFWKGKGVDKQPDTTRNTAGSAEKAMPAKSQSTAEKEETQAEVDGFKVVVSKKNKKKGKQSDSASAADNN